MKLNRRGRVTVLGCSAWAWVLVAASVAAAAPGDVSSVDLQVVGQSSLPSPGLDGETKPRGNNGDIAALKNTAYIAAGAAYYGGRATSGRICSDHGGVKVVDLSNPASPQLQTPITITDSTGVGAPWRAENPRRGAQFPNVSGTATSVDARSVSTASFTGDLLAISVFRCEPNFFSGDGRLEFWDVSNPAAPVELGQTLTQPATADDVQIIERAGKVYALATVPFSSSQVAPNNDFRVYDITNPASPTIVGGFPALTPPASVPISSSNGCQTFLNGRAIAATADGSRAFLSYYDGPNQFDADPNQTEALFELDLLPTLDAPTPPVQPNVLSTWGYVPGNPAVEGRGSDDDVEGNAADVELLAGRPEGGEIAVVSEDDVDPAFTRLTIDAPAVAASNWRGCESLLDSKLYLQPGQQVSAPIAYVGRGCPGSKLTGSPNVAPDPYVENPAGKIALFDSSSNTFDGCSPRERFQRAIDAGAVGVMSHTGEDLLNSTSNGPQGGDISAPAMTIILSAYKAMQYVPSTVFTSFPSTWQRTTTSNVTTVAIPGRTDRHRFRSVADATDRVARGEVNPANRFAVVAGQQYSASALMEVTARVDGEFRTAVEWFDSTDTSLGTDVIQSLSAVTPEQRFAQTFTAPANATKAAVKFEWTGASAEGTGFAQGFSFSPAELSGTIKAEQGQWGAQRLIDFSGASPAEVGTYRSPTSQVWPPPDNGIYAPRQARTISNDLVASTWLSDGLRVLDVSNPSAPSEVGSFVPGAAADPSADSGAGSTAIAPRTDSPSLQLKRGRAWPDRTLINGVAVLSSGANSATIAVTDINAGLYVLQATVNREQAPPATPPATPKPSNDFILKKGSRNKKIGTQKLKAIVPGAGDLVLKGKGIRRKKKNADGAGKVIFVVKTKGNKADKLDDDGRVRVKPRVTFTPDGGDPKSKSKKLKLIQRDRTRN